MKRFWDKVDKSGECWEWTGHTTAAGKGYGYGRWNSSGTLYSTLAHRAAWQMTNGPIPDELNVCHKCDNRKCVRPDHMFLGTDLDNNRDMRRKGRAIHRGIPGSAHPFAKLTEEKVLEIRRRLAGGESLASVGRAFEVTMQNIFAIKARITWKHI